jgi:SAM-dependent methyltransferase
LSLFGQFAKWAARRALDILPSREAGAVIEQIQIRAAGADPRIGAYALECNNPQAICFLIDVYADLQAIFSRYPRLGEIRFLDIGPAFGGSAGLLAQMHRSHFLGPRLQVDVLDITNERQRFIEFTYPLVQFKTGRIESLTAEQRWDVVYCSNAIEHMENPQAFIRSVLKHTEGYAVFLAPYKEADPMSLDHKSRIDESTFNGFNLECVRVFKSAAWPTTADGVVREQMLAIVRSENSLRPEPQ